MEQKSVKCTNQYLQNDLRGHCNHNRKTGVMKNSQLENKKVFFKIKYIIPEIIKKRLNN